MDRPLLFAELFAGSAAVSLALIGGSRLRPPVAYMGAKTRYAETILGALGLRPGQGSDALLLCDAGPWGWAWKALLDPDTARSVAAILRGWSAEDPTALWRRLAAEPPAPLEDLRDAQVLWLQGKTASSVPIGWNGTRWEMATGARWRRSMRPLCMKGENSAGGGLTSTVTVAERVEAIAAAVAKWMALQDANHGAKPVHVEGGRWRVAGYAHLSDSARARGFRERLRTDLLAEGVDELVQVEWPPIAVHHGDVSGAIPDGDLTGCVFYLDPPYVGCTGYPAECAREWVLTIALALSSRGAIVAVSEAEPLDLPGWHTVELTGSGAGQAQTFRRSKAEWLTMNREPAARPGVQTSMFAAGA
jgi:hypothetical protein